MDTTHAPALTLDELAARLNVHLNTAYRLVTTGKIPAFRVGAQWRVAAATVEQIEAGELAVSPLSRHALDAAAEDAVQKFIDSAPPFSAAQQAAVRAAFRAGSST